MRYLLFLLFAASAWAVPARVTNQFCSATAGTGGTNPLAVSCSLPSTPTVGKHILGTCINVSSNNTTPTISDNQSGNSYAVDGRTFFTGQGGVNNFSGKIAAASGTFTVTCTFNSFTIYASVIVGEYSGLASSNWFDVTAGASGSTTGTHSSGSTATTAQASEILIGGIAMACNGCTLTAGSGYSVLTTVNNASASWKLGLEDEVVSSTGTYAATFTDSQGFGDWIAVITTYKGASSGPPPGQYPVIR